MVLMMLPLMGLALRNAFAAYLLWGWSSLFGPQSYMYGFMGGVQYVQLFALITLFLVLFKRDPHLRLNQPQGAVGLWLGAFGVHGVIVALLAYPDLPRNQVAAEDLLKIVLFCLLMPMLVTNRTRVRVLLLAIFLSFATHGVIEGLKFVASGGGHISQGNARMGDRNYFAVYMVMCLPLAIYLFTQLRHRLARVTLGGVIVLLILAVISSQSRGGLVALLALGLWLILRSRRRMVGIAAVAVGAVLVVSYAPERWFERMETIQTAGEDASFGGRMTAWKRASAIAMDHPLEGGGHFAVQSRPLFEKYLYSDGFLGSFIPGFAEIPLAAHSIYFEVLGNMGFVGLFIFLALMLSPFVMARRTRRLVKAKGASVQWAADLTTMLSLAMVAYLVGGAAVSMVYIDLPYILIALTAVTYRIAAHEDGESGDRGRPGPQPEPALGH